MRAWPSPGSTCSNGWPRSGSELPAAGAALKPVCLLGGTFDPVHLGHLRLAEELGEALGVDEVRLMPAGLPPHRHAPRASAHHRLAMVQLAIAGNPRLRADDHEVAHPGPSYMVDTLTHLRDELGGGTPLILFLGADAFQGLPTWHRWRELFRLAHLAVAHRPGFSPTRWEDTLAAELLTEWHSRRAEQPAALWASQAGHVWLHPITQMDISASRIRNLAGQAASIRYLVPDPVLDYIERHQLYRQEES